MNPNGTTGSIRYRADGAGYSLLGDVIIDLNEINPQIAARLLTPLSKWRSYRLRGDVMREQLQRLADRSDLSVDVFEVVSKSLA